MNHSEQGRPDQALSADEREAILRAVRDYTEQYIAPNALRWDEEKHFPREELRVGGELGLGGISVSEESGGVALSRTDAAAIFEEIARGCPTIAAYLSIHNMVAAMIDRYGSAEQKERWLPLLTSLEGFGAYCLTEPGTGSDAAAIVTSAVRDGDEYVLNGVKQFISGGGEAAVYVVMARTADTGARGISAFLVPDGTAGLGFGVNEKKMGWNAQPTRQVILDGVRIPVSGRLGEEHSGFKMAMSALDGGRINIGACSIGGAQWALERAAAYVHERFTFGEPLAERQTILFTLADMATELRAARLMVRDAAVALDDRAALGGNGRGPGADGVDVAVRCAMAKRIATDVGFRVANEALQLHGGYGYLHDYGIEKVVRDLRVHQILEGTNEIMRLIVGRSVLESGARQ